MWMSVIHFQMWNVVLQVERPTESHQEQMMEEAALASLIPENHTSWPLRRSLWLLRPDSSVQLLAHMQDQKAVGGQLVPYTKV
jgi:hypothetical protein